MWSETSRVGPIYIPPHHDMFLPTGQNNLWASARENNGGRSCLKSRHKHWTFLPNETGFVSALKSPSRISHIENWNSQSCKFSQAENELILLHEQIVVSHKRNSSSFNTNLMCLYPVCKVWKTAVFTCFKLPSFCVCQNPQVECHLLWGNFYLHTIFLFTKYWLWFNSTQVVVLTRLPKHGTWHDSRNLVSHCTHLFASLETNLAFKTQRTTLERRYTTIKANQTNVGS